MEQSFDSMFEDIRHELLLIRLLSPTCSDCLRESKFTDLEMKKVNTLALEKFNRHKKLKDYVAVSLLE